MNVFWWTVLAVEETGLWAAFLWTLLSRQVTRRG